MGPETSIYEYARRGFEINPNKTAVYFYGKAISYRELSDEIDRTADQLASLGVGKGSVVTVRLPNCPQTIMAVYAVAKLGGISNMVHALLPAEGLRANMEFTKSSFLISGSHISDYEKIDFADRILYVDVSAYMGKAAKFGYALKTKSTCPENAYVFGAKSCVEQSKMQLTELSPEDACLYLHSSGSTGEPKAVILNHVALNNGIEMTRYYFRGTDITAQVCLSALPYFHALGFQMDMHRVLSCGGTLVMLSRWDAKKAVSLIKKRRVTVMVGVPAMCRALVKRKNFSGPRVSQLCEFFVGGEKMEDGLKREMDRRMGAEDAAKILEGYGLTETASVCAVLGKGHYHIDACGYPMDGVTAMLLQKDGSLQSVGEGELLIGGKSLMTGYLNDPEATKQAFFKWNGQDLLRTGDYARIDEEGLIYYIDRIKNTIIRKGNSLYPREIEAVIRRTQGVVEVCVMGIPDKEDMTQKVCAFVVPDGDIPNERLEELVLEECRRFLPEISVPGKIVFLKELPKNQMGKVERPKLEKITE